MKSEMKLKSDTKSNMMKHCMITAHSGADGTPENSLEYIRYAMSLPVDAIEFDVRSAYGSLMLGHDKAGDMKLEDALELLKSSSQMINFDLKEKGLCGPVYNFLQQYGMISRAIFSGTVPFEELNDAIRNDIRIFLNIEEVIPGLYDRLKKEPSYIKEAAEHISSVCISHNIHVVNAYYMLATDEFLSILDNHDIGVSLWTVSEPKLLTKFMQKNLYNITTRTPQDALQIRKAFAESLK